MTRTGFAAQTLSVSKQRDGRGDRREQKRLEIKAIAQRLFARGGLDGVSTRAIVEAAGQRNVALVTIISDRATR